MIQYSLLINPSYLSVKNTKPPQENSTAVLHFVCEIVHTRDIPPDTVNLPVVRFAGSLIARGGRIISEISKGNFMLPTSHSPRQNHLIAALPTADYERLLPALELLPLPLGWSVYETGSKQSCAYFPTDSIISLVYVIASGNLTEVAVTGNEGLVGIPLFTGGEATQGRAVVRNAGFAYRLKYAVLKKEFENGGPLQDLLLRYTQSLMTQIAQNAVCNRYHTVEQRLCRWLLMSFDRLPSNQLQTTQELIANMLGVRREGVTEAAIHLQDAGLIRYSRGHITILDRPRLEEWACECYSVVKRETDRLLPRKQSGAISGRKSVAAFRETMNPMYATAQPSSRQPGMISKE